MLSKFSSTVMRMITALIAATCTLDPIVITALAFSPSHESFSPLTTDVRRCWQPFTSRYSIPVGNVITSTALRVRPSDSGGFSNKSSREDEIRRKIMKLKKDGRIKRKENVYDEDSTIESVSSKSESTLDKLSSERKSARDSPIIDKYAEKIKDKLGSKGKLIGTTGGVGNLKTTLRNIYENDDSDTLSVSASSLNSGTNEHDEERDVEDDDLVELVERKLREKRMREAQVALKQKEQGRVGQDIDEIAELMEKEAKEQLEQLQQKNETVISSPSLQESTIVPQKMTNGIGGSWAKNETSKVDTYRPANGGWGYFPRPKDISKAYGGGKRIGAGVQTTLEDEQRRAIQEEATKEKLRRYREKVGIEVQSEKDNAKEIEDALAIGQRAMQRGVYNVAVSALEKVTKYCSTNSKVGGAVFLELAMAYEAVGQTQEAITIYSTLTNSRMEDIKFNAKRLLLGVEAMQFMRNEAKSEAFSRQKVKQTFIDTTGLANIADNFDKVYNTAYIDLDRGGGFYRKLTESVVRSIREARQILLRATGSGEVDRLKIVQALRSISRNFVSALDDEIKKNSPKKEPVAVMNGVPIARKSVESKETSSVENFYLASAEQMMENLNGEWRLQLIADKKGDGVKFFNSTLSWQLFDTSSMNFKSMGPTGFLTLEQSGDVEFDTELRIISRVEVKSEGSGAFLAGIFGESNLSSASAAINLPQQIISVDSELLVTQAAYQSEKLSNSNNIKDYFSVWRRVESGTFSAES